MINAVFPFVYGLRIPVLVFGLCMLTAVAAWLYHRCHRNGRSKLWIWMLLAVCLVLVVSATLLARNKYAEAPIPLLLPFSSYMRVLWGENTELLRSNFMNVLLFYPVSLFGAMLLPEKVQVFWRILLVSAVLLLLSCGIEFLQYAWMLGRAETDDVLHNALGAVLGSTIGSRIVSWQKR